MKSYELKLTASQEQDCEDPGDEPQFLEIFTGNGGGGDYFILKTERWAFDSPQEFFDLINEFIEAHGRIQRNEEKEGG
jgi:hypothetical protein